MEKKDKCYIIAEIASAHNGNINEIKDLIKESYNADADAVNFQIFDKDELIVRSDPRYKNFEKIEFSRPQWKEILDYAKTFNGHIAITPFDNESLNLFGNYADVFKLPSSDINNPFLIDEMADYRKPVFVAIGGSSLEEIARCMDRLKKKCDVTLMHGFQAFPTKIEDTNLRLIKTLYDKFGVPIGFLDHIDGSDELAITLPVAAYSFGAVAIEKHITIDRSKKGFDFYSSLEPHEFKKMVGLIRKLEGSLGDGQYVMGGDEVNYRLKMKKSIVARNNISSGHVIKLQDLAFKRSKEGLSPSMAYEVTGRLSKYGLSRDDALSFDSLSEQRAIICLAVRLSSNRLPRKALVQIGSQTSIEHEIDRLKSTGLEVILCTSTNEQDTPLVDLADKKNIKYFRGHELNILHRFIGAAKRENADVVVRITGDRPLVSPEYIIKAVEHHIKTNAEYTHTKGLPDGTISEVMSVSALEKANRLAEDPNNSEYMTLYFRRPDIFKVEHVPIEENVKRNYRITLDTPEDLELIRKIYDNLYQPGKVIPLVDIVNLLDNSPDLVKINKDVKEIDTSKINLRMKID